VQIFLIAFEEKSSIKYNFNILSNKLQLCYQKCIGKPNNLNPRGKVNQRACIGSPRSFMSEGEEP
jgi:hypothetical protein